ncbi:MAG: energy transducer TonB, partial [Acidobacteriota bacterium]
MRLIYSIHLLISAIFMVIIGVSSSLEGSERQEHFNQTGLVHKTRDEIERSAIKRVEPVYPPLASAGRLLGTVDVSIVIDEEGNVISARALIGHSMLKGAAVEAVRRWKFKTTKVNGKAVKVMGPITFIFKA